MQQFFETLWSRFGDIPIAIVILGLVGQTVFMGRFLVQWIASERAGKSVIPVAFWWLSLVGSVLLLSYALLRADPVFILAQSFGGIVYIRNLMLIHQQRTAT